MDMNISAVIRAAIAGGISWRSASVLTGLPVASCQHLAGVIMRAMNEHYTCEAGDLDTTDYHDACTHTNAAHEVRLVP